MDDRILIVGGRTGNITLALLTPSTVTTTTAVIDHGYCTIRTATDGKINGSCQSTSLGDYFNVTGSVDAAGALVFTSSSGGGTTSAFSGTLAGHGS